VTARATNAYRGCVPVPVVGYIRSLPAEPPSVLRAQAAAIRHAAAVHLRPAPYQLKWIVRDEAVEHPSRLTAAVRHLQAGRARALLVTRWDRLGPDPAMIQALRREAVANGWALEVLDGGELDDGASFRSTRTVEGLAEARAMGVRLGRPRRCDDEVLRTVVELHLTGVRQADIAAQLNIEGTPTPGGGARWYPSHVSRLLRTQDADEYRRRQCSRR